MPGPPMAGGPSSACTRRPVTAPLLLPAVRVRGVPGRVHPSAPQTTVFGTPYLGPQTSVLGTPYLGPRTSVLGPRTPDLGLRSSVLVLSILESEAIRPRTRYTESEAIRPRTRCTESEAEVYRGRGRGVPRPRPCLTSTSAILASVSVWPCTGLGLRPSAFGL